MIASPPHTATSLLQAIRRAGGRLHLNDDGEHFAVRPASAVTPELRAAIPLQRAALIGVARRQERRRLAMAMWRCTESLFLLGWPERSLAEDGEPGRAFQATWLAALRRYEEIVQ